MGLRQPFNSISHMAAGGLAAIGLVVLVILADGTFATIAALVYGFGLLAVFTMSALFHAIRGGPRTLKWLERLDHVAIYLLIAGTYTPITLLLLGGAWGWSLFGVVWGISIVGIVLALTLPLGPEWVHIVGYITLGWVAIVATPVFLPILTPAGLALLVTGGVTYTVGAFLYTSKRQRFIGRLGPHEVWHLLVIMGAASHFAFIAIWVF